MRSVLSLVLLFAVSAFAFADPLVVTVTDRDEDGNKMPKNLRKLTIVMEHTADREQRLIEFLKTQELVDRQVWRQWTAKRKDGDIVNYTVYVDVNPGFVKFRMVTDTDVQKVYIVDGHASFAAMRALAGERFQLYTLGDEIVFGRRKTP